MSSKYAFMFYELRMSYKTHNSHEKSIFLMKNFEWRLDFHEKPNFLWKISNWNSNLQWNLHFSWNFEFSMRNFECKIGFPTKFTFAIQIDNFYENPNFLWKMLNGNSNLYEITFSTKIYYVHWPYFQWNSRLKVEYECNFMYFPKLTTQHIAKLSNLL